MTNRQVIGYFKKCGAHIDYISVDRSRAWNRNTYSEPSERSRFTVTVQWGPMARYNTGHGIVQGYGDTIKKAFEETKAKYETEVVRQGKNLEHVL